MPSLTPGGPNGFACIALLLLPLGAYVSASHCRWRPAFFIYGCLGSFAFVPLVLPGGRAYLGPGPGPDPFAITLFALLIVLVGGTLCRIIAQGRHNQIDYRSWVVSYKCRKCGYSLYGLTKPRCPECAEPFDPSILRRKPIDDENADALGRLADLEAGEEQSTDENA